MVQQIAELHGGTVAVYGAHDGPGAEFVVSLPLALTPGATPPPPRLPRRALNHSLLVVDDNVDAANTLRIVLEAIGYRVRVAFDGNDVAGSGTRRTGSRRHDRARIGPYPDHG